MELPLQCQRSCAGRLKKIRLEAESSTTVSTEPGSGRASGSDQTNQEKMCQKSLLCAEPTKTFRGALAFGDAAQAACSNARGRSVDPANLDQSIKEVN